MKPLLFRTAALLLPLLLLIAVEGALRLAGVGAASREAFVPVPGQEDHLALSPAYVARYFPSFRPGVAFTPFARERAPGTLRLMALGGSTTAGFPYSFYYGFPARLQARLQDADPLRRVEMVNLGLSAVNSFTLWDLRRAVAAQQPDAVLIYAGHNEFYGALGAASTAGGLGQPLWLKRLVLRLKRTALYTGLERLLAPRPDDGADRRTLMARVVGDAAIERDGPVFERAVAHYEANLRAVVETFGARGIPVYLSTLTSNLADRAPLGLDARADSLFAAGRAALAAGDTLAARAAFVGAREHDPVRFRAPEAINDVVRRVAADHPHVTLVDVEAAFRQVAGGVEGDALFTDHLHPDAEGYDLMAATFARALPAEWRGAGRPADDPTVDPLEATHAALQIERLEGGFPFVRDRAPEAEEAAFRSALARRLRSGRYPDSLAAEVILGRRSMYRALDEAVDTARARGDTLAALQLYAALLHWQPFNEGLMQQAVGYALAAPRHADAVGPLARFAAARSASRYHRNALAAVRLRQGRYDEAEALLAAVEADAPDEPVMLYNTARLLALRGDTASARRYFERYRRAQP